jgi:hypothetical protein
MPVPSGPALGTVVAEIHFPGVVVQLLGESPFGERPEPRTERSSSREAAPAPQRPRPRRPRAEQLSLPREVR